MIRLVSSRQDDLERWVRRRLDRRLRSRVDEADVLQEAYVDAIRRISAGGPAAESPLSLWFRSIAQQKIVDMYRFHLGAKRRDARREIREGSGDSATIGGLLEHFRDPSSPDAADQAALRNELISHVQRALGALRPQDRTVLLLRHRQELSFEEIAAVLAVPTATAMKRYYRALRRCRRELLRLPAALLDPWVSTS